jgi:hypothetical protein
MAAIPELEDDLQFSFVIHGGLRQDGSLSQDLWHFDFQSRQWSLKTTGPTQPPPLSKHTLNLANGYLYLFGGSMTHGKFSNQMYRINATTLEEWEWVQPKGGRLEDLYVTGHRYVNFRLNIQLLIIIDRSPSACHPTNIQVYLSHSLRKN